MDKLEIKIKSLEIGSTLKGEVSWYLKSVPSSAEVRLFWYTEGKGDQDVILVDKIDLPALKAYDTRSFSFPLPKSPYSFSGKFISLIWAVEVIVSPFDMFAREEFVLSPSGEEVRI